MISCLCRGLARLSASHSAPLTLLVAHQRQHQPVGVLVAAIVVRQPLLGTKSQSLIERQRLFVGVRHLQPDRPPASDLALADHLLQQTSGPAQTTYRPADGSA